MAIMESCYGNPKCYARILGNCSREVSGEHFISRSVLQLLGDYHRISNAGWFEPGVEHKDLSTEALRAKVLCKKHNEMLSYLDDEAKLFFSELIDAFSEHMQDATCHKVRVSGDNIERWMLKTLLGALSSGCLLGSRRRIVVDNPPVSLVEELFSHAPSNRLARLCILRAIVKPYPGFCYGLMYDAEHVKISGSILEFIGVGLAIAFDEGILQMKNIANEELTPLICRPGKIHIESQYRTTDIEVSWSNWSPTEYVSFVANKGLTRKRGSSESGVSGKER